MRFFLDLGPVELCRKKGRFRYRIGNFLPLRGIAEFRKPGKFFAATAAHRIREVRTKIAKEQKWPFRPPFLPHENHRYLRKQKIHRNDCADRLRRGELRQTLTECAVTNLIVVL